MTRFEKLKLIAKENNLVLQQLIPARGDVKYVVTSNELGCSDDCGTLDEVVNSIRDLKALSGK